MVYKSIPLATDFLSQSQIDIKANFDQANTSFSVNHTPFNIASNNGKHKFVQMPQGAIPSGRTIGDGALYVKSSSSNPDLFYTPDVAGKEYQLTRTNDSSYGSFSTDAAYTSGATPPGATTVGGWTFLPGGLLLQYGTVTAPGNPSTTVNFPIAFSTACYVVTISIKRTSGANDNLFINAKNTTTFTYFASTSGSGFQSFDFIAIGK